MEAGLAAPDNNRKPPVPRDTTHGNTGCLGFAGQQWPALTCVHHEPVEPACRQEGVQEDEGLGTETDEVTGFRSAGVGCTADGSGNDFRIAHHAAAILFAHTFSGLLRLCFVGTSLSTFCQVVGCDLAVLNADTVRNLLGCHIDERNRAVYVNKSNHIRTDEESRRQSEGYTSLLAFKLAQTGRRYNREVVRSILRSILFDYLELMTVVVPTGETSVEGQRKVLFQQFLELLSMRHVKHQPVDTHAQELCVSPGYLTKVCKDLSGKTAMKWIREYTEQDVRYCLTNSDRSVKEICKDLGFPDLSFFSKFCRRALGCSPTAYRKKAKASRDQIPNV